MMKIKIDTEKCIGCGTCVSLCSDKFEMDDDKVKVHNEVECGCDLEDIMENCPVDAILKDE